jgi:hypothetical protein|tara:strand:- start:306 stop:506 length:201 start_codon:yes stop_codon:yes gene_type:complete
MSRYAGTFAKPENALKRAVRFPVALAPRRLIQLKPFSQGSHDGFFSSPLTYLTITHLASCAFYRRS